VERVGRARDRVGAPAAPPPRRPGPGRSLQRGQRRGRRAPVHARIAAPGEGPTPGGRPDHGGPSSPAAAHPRTRRRRRRGGDRPGGAGREGRRPGADGRHRELRHLPLLPARPVRPVRPDGAVRPRHRPHPGRRRGAPPRLPRRLRRAGRGARHPARPGDHRPARRPAGVDPQPGVHRGGRRAAHRPGRARQRRRRGGLRASRPVLRAGGAAGPGRADHRDRPAAPPARGRPAPRRHHGPRPHRGRPGRGRHGPLGGPRGHQPGARRRLRLRGGARGPGRRAGMGHDPLGRAPDAGRAERGPRRHRHVPHEGVLQPRQDGAQLPAGLAADAPRPALDGAARRAGAARPQGDGRAQLRPRRGRAGHAGRRRLLRARRQRGPRR